jgi:hypothetical protein
MIDFADDPNRPTTYSNVGEVDHGGRSQAEPLWFMPCLAVILRGQNQATVADNPTSAWAADPDGARLS